jgi:hypothetical protein
MIRFVLLALAVVSFVAASLGDTLNLFDRHMNFFYLGLAFVTAAYVAFPARRRR